MQEALHREAERRVVLKLPLSTDALDALSAFQSKNNRAPAGRVVSALLTLLNQDTQLQERTHELLRRR